MPVSMELIRTVLLVGLVVGSVAGLVWLMRPSVRTRCEEAAMIPLRDDADAQGREDAR